MKDERLKKNILWLILRTLLPGFLILVIIWGLIQFRLTPIIKDAFVEAEKELVIELTNTAFSMIEHYHRRVQQQDLSLQEAQARVKERLRNVRYGEDDNGYFWIIDSQFFSIMHPFSGREGLSDYGQVDEAGNYFVRDFVQIALTDGSGFIEYQYFNPATNTSNQKITYLRYFEPWDWIVGTGVYYDQALLGFTKAKQLSNFFLVFIFGLVGVWAVVYGVRKETAIANEKKALQIIKKNEEDLEILFNNAFQFVGLVNQNGILVKINRTALEFIGEPEAYVVGKYFWETPWWIGDAVTQENAKYAVIQALEGQFKRLELKNYGKEQKVIDIDVSFKPVFNDEHKVDQVIVEGRDITNLLDAQNLIMKQVKLLHSLRTIDQVIMNGDSFFDISNGIFRQIFELIPLDAAILWQYDSISQELTSIFRRGFQNNQIREKIQWALSSDMGSVINQQPVDPQRFLFLREENFLNSEQVLFVNQTKVVGLLQVFTRREEPFSSEEHHILKVIGEQGAIAIENIRMVTDLRYSNQQLLLSYDHTLAGWAKALGVRDNETQGHSERVTELTIRLAKRIGIQGEELLHIRRGAILHDVGKMGIPDRILLKPGKLTDEEWELMRLHPVYAFQFLSPIPFLKPALDIPYCHHEWWNGRGYPRGLVGEQIPIAACIFSVIDVWDALTNDRPYRRAWPKEKVLDYLRELRGKQFDPAIVDSFIEMIQAEVD